MSDRWGPGSGPRYRFFLSVVGLAVALCAAPDGVDGATKQAKRCPAGQVTRTISYVHRKGGPADHASGCVVRTPTAPKTFVAVAAKLRALALSLAPAKVVRALRSPAARRVAAIDAKTDAALAALEVAHAQPPATLAARRRGLRVTAPTGPDTVTNDNGTETKHLNRFESLDTFDDVGEAFETVTTTRPTRVTGHKSAKDVKTLTVRHVTKRCPDAGGLERGTLHFSLSEERSSGGAVLTITSTLDTQIVGHFDENAHLASVDVAGTWSYKSSTRSVSGTVSSGRFHENVEGQRTLSLDSATTTGSDDDIVLGGRVTALWITTLANDYVQEMVNGMTANGCVVVVPDATTVHVRQGATVAIVAHLTDRHGQAFPGVIKEFDPLDRVAPPQFAGSPDATFIYTAPADAKPGDTDIVHLSHVSKRGTSLVRGGDVTVVVDAGGLPQRFTGTWTRVITFVTGVTFTQTIDGTATFQLNPLFPTSYAAFTSLPYDVVSATVTWKITAGACTASGQSTPDMTNATRVTLEDVTNNSAAPHPEPQPYYYAIRVAGTNPQPTYDFTACGLGTGVISPLYLDIGYGSPFDSSSPTDRLVKSSSPALLAGHATSSQAGLDFDDTWNFAGSG